MAKKYIAKPNTWFDEGTEAKLLADCGFFGIFEGIREGKPDEETCLYEEFEVIEE